MSQVCELADVPMSGLSLYYLTGPSKSALSLHTTTDRRHTRLSYAIFSSDGNEGAPGVCALDNHERPHACTQAGQDLADPLEVA